MTAIVISTVNMKGGVGKTTLTVNLATCLAKYQRAKVLVLDLDSQISATLSLMSPHEFADIRKRKKTVTYLLNAIIQPNPYNKLNIDDIISSSVCGIEGLDLLPGDIELYDEFIVSETLHHQAILQEDLGFDRAWNNLERNLLQKILDPIKERYDYIIMDCAPGYNLLTRSALCVSNFYILPARPEPLSIVGIQLLQRRINKLKESHGENAPIDPNLLGIVFIMSAGGLLSRYYNQVMRRVQQDFTPEQIFSNSIPMDVNIVKAVDMFVPAVASMPSSAGSKAFMKLTEEVLIKAKKGR